jgi:acetyl esterase/lipase
MFRTLLNTSLLAVVATNLVAYPSLAQPPSENSQPRIRRERPQESRQMPLPDSVQAMRDVEYARVGDRTLLLDLYIPQDSDKPLPLIVWIHGGGWRSGNKDRCTALPMARRGFAVASISYRLSGEAIFPAQIEDCKAAIRWLRANAQKLNVAAGQIGVWGSSAGGHLVALLGTSGDVADLEGEIGNHLDQSSRVQAVCDFFGPTDFLQMDAHMLPDTRLVHDSPESPESLLVGGPIQDHPDKVARANPITYISDDDPPFLIMHGDKDPLVPLHQSQLLHEALQKAGVPSRLHVVQGAGHGLGGPDVMRMVCEFFESRLKMDAPAPRKQQAESTDREDHPAEVSEAKPPQQRKDEPIADITPELATHEEVEPLGVEFKRLTAFRLRQDGSLLACDADAKEIKVINVAGEQTDVIAVDFAPEALDLASDDTIFCGGQGRIVHLSADGSIIGETKVPDDAATEITSRRRSSSQPIRVSGIATSDQDVFVAFGSGWSTGSKSKLYRFDLQLQNPVLIAEGLRGCCQRCDIIARDGVLYLAENSAHRVVLYNRDGEVLNKWGERSRTDLLGFGACCNPMNLCFDAEGILYTSESGLGRVKRYTTDGQYIDLVGYVGTTRFWNGSSLAASCSNITIAVTPDASRVFVMDYKNNQIRILQQKETKESKGAE